MYGAALILALLAGAAPPPPPPSVVLVLVDDLRWDALGCTGAQLDATPAIDRLAAGGLVFESAFVPISLCSPSRASLLTGCRPQRTGVRSNDGTGIDPEVPTFPQLLREHGYDTAFVGKWHLEPVLVPRGFDHSVLFGGGGKYEAPKLNVDGELRFAEGYTTDVLTEYAERWIEKRSDDRPFLLVLSHRAVHTPFTPAERHGELFADAEIALPPSIHDDLESKPDWVRELLAPLRLASKDIDPAEARAWYVPYFRTLRAVDESVARVVAALELAGRSKTTVVIVTSDNGMMIGEHGLHGAKQWAYEESIRIPLVIAGPRVPVGKRSSLVSSLDIAPTILAWAGIAPPSVLHGRDLAPLIADDAVGGWREAIYYEYFASPRWPMPHLRAVRTQRWKYITSPDHPAAIELYDLQSDPYELNNLAGPESTAVEARMRELLHSASRAL